MTRDVAGIDMALLRALRALVHESSVTHAAQSLGVGQPAMSAQLKRLRTIFSDPILTRSGAASKPTERAVELASTATDILANIALLEAGGRSTVLPHEISQTVTIAATDYARQTLLDRLLPRLRSEAPGLHLRFQRSDRDRVREWMEQGIVDLGIGAATIPTGRLRSRTLYQETVCCVAAQGVLPPILTPEVWCGLPQVQVITARHSEIETMIESRLRQLGLEREIALTVPDFSDVIDIVRSTTLMAALPRGYIKRFTQRNPQSPPELEYRPLPFVVPHVTMTLYWHERTDRSPAHAWLRSAIIGAFQSYAP